MLIAKLDNTANPVLSRGLFNNGFPVLTRGARDPLVNPEEEMIWQMALAPRIVSIAILSLRRRIANIAKNITSLFRNPEALKYFALTT
jgi:hypothetical protein